MFFAPRPDARWWLVRLTKDNRHEPVVIPGEAGPARTLTREEVWQAHAKGQRFAFALGVCFVLGVASTYFLLKVRPGFDIFDATMLGFGLYAAYLTVRAWFRWRQLTRDLRALGGP